MLKSPRVHAGEGACVPVIQAVDISHSVDRAEGIDSRAACESRRNSYSPALTRGPLTSRAFAGRPCTRPARAFSYTRSRRYPARRERVWLRRRRALLAADRTNKLFRAGGR